MNLSDICNTNCYYSGITNYLSLEEKITFQTSLTILKAENKFRHVFYWGKILTETTPYYIAQGRRLNFVEQNTTFYSLDGLTWKITCKPATVFQNYAKAIKMRLKGDPSFHARLQKPPLGVDATEWPQYLKEEDRVTAIVANIDQECAIIPRGALIKDARHVVTTNPSFVGLNRQEASNAKNYLHLRVPDLTIDGQLPWPQERNPDKSIDFLEPISYDLPRDRCWSVVIDKTSGLANIRSFWWPGYEFVHVIGTPNYGGVYIGDGLKNEYLPFMV